MTRVNTLTEIWNTYSNKVIHESAPAAKAAKFGTKPGPGPKELNKADAGHFANDDTSGPANAEGVKEINDPQKEVKSKKKKVNNEQLDKKVGKKVKESINNYMKSTFDKLFENVMSDEEQGELEALGVTETETDEASGDEVTITLDKSMAKALCDLLQDAMGEDDADDAEAEDYEMEEFPANEAEEDADAEEDEEHDDEEDEDEEVAQEAVEAEDHGHALVNQKDSGLTSTKNNKVGTLKTSKKKSDGKVKKQDDSGSELGDAGGHSLTNPKAKVVGNLKVNADLFGD